MVISPKVTLTKMAERPQPHFLNGRQRKAAPKLYLPREILAAGRRKEVAAVAAFVREVAVEDPREAEAASAAFRQ